LDLIRRFEADDIEQVANLHKNVFQLDVAEPLQSYYCYFSEQFLSNSLPSLVCEAEDGRILGFLGVAERHFSFAGRKVIAALSSQFVVHPEGRGRLTAINLLREFLKGPQDLSFTDEANSASERLWVGLGGSVATLQGVHWVLPLRPARLACDRYASRQLAAVLRGPANLLDRMLSALPRRLFHDGEPALRGEPLSAPTMLACLHKVTADCALRPQYSEASLGALLERAGRKTGRGALRGVLLRSRENDVAGWYLYYCNGDRLAEVLQIAARAGSHSQVIEHLTSDARRFGAIAVVGRLEPGLAEPLANRFCLLFRRKYAMLVHSRSSEILAAIHSGRAFISRLDGEWCVRFA
jgi:hypothetical protein